VSRFFKSAFRAESFQSDSPTDWGSLRRPFKVLSVTSNKGGVGKTTLACNLAVYFRAMREDLPILVLSLDDQFILDRMFAMDAVPSDRSLVEAMRAGDLAPAIRGGEFGIQFIPSSRDIALLKRSIPDLYYLQRVLLQTNFEGLVIVDTKSDFEILTQNAIMASDHVMVAVKDYASLLEADRVFEFLESVERPKERARIVLSLMDLRVKFSDGPADILELLVQEIRKKDYPLYASFMSRSAKIEALATNPAARVHSILHGAPQSIAHRQMSLLAGEVLTQLGLRSSPATEEPVRPMSSEEHRSIRRAGEMAEHPAESFARRIERALGSF
jgi:chromosome partitioning protein